MKKITETLKLLAQQDPSLCVDRDKVDETFGHHPDYLFDTYGITKSDLIRLERLGLAMKARYVTRNKTGKAYFKDAEGNLVPVDGEHRVRWVLFKE